MVLGCDLSHWNSHDISYIKAGFMFLKASEGASKRDEKFNEYIKRLAEKIELEDMPYLGAYHYAHPELNTPAMEAANFINAIRPHIGNIMCALDWEGYAINVEHGQDWALHWLDSVGNITGSTPIFYIQASSFDKYPLITKEFPTWVACYSQESRKGKYKAQCDKADFLQITSHPIDIDLFAYSPVELARIIKGDFRKGVI